jgi:hypothetical protein
MSHPYFIKFLASPHPDAYWLALKYMLFLERVTDSSINTPTKPTLI